MSINLSPNRLQRAYLVEETTFATVPTATATNNCIFTKCSVQAVVNNIVRPDLTGYRSSTFSMAGRQSGTWNFDCSLAGNGTAGTAPDVGPILTSVFGQDPVVVAATSVTYGLSDSIKTFSLFHYRTPSTMTQRIAFGSVASDCTFVLGNDIASLSSNGTSVWVVDSDGFSTATTAEKGGLSSFPAEPGTHTPHGTYAVIGFTGAVSFDGNVIATLKTATIKIATGNRLIDDTYNSFTPTGAIGDERTVSISFVCDDTDTVGLQDLKTKAKAKTPVIITMQSGLIPGNIWSFTLNGVQMAEPSYSEGNKSVFQVSFGESIAHGTALGALDDCVLVLT